MESNCGDMMPLSYNEDGTIAYIEGKTDHGGALTKMEFYDKNDHSTQMHRASYALTTEFDERGNIVYQGRATITMNELDKCTEPHEQSNRTKVN